jgi:signal peptide peptidase SppA
VDGAAFLDEILERERTPDMVELATYARVDPSDVGFRPQATFALVYGAGGVTTGSGGGRARGPSMASDDLIEAFDEASRDASVRAIVFRIDSPGGSALASDLIWRAVRRARDKGKPVIASLSDVAASGGYYVAAAADRIVAEPGTLTGSIGVFVIRPTIGGALEKLGVGVEGLTRGRYADILLAAPALAGTRRAAETSEHLPPVRLARREGGDGADAVSGGARPRRTGAQARARPRRHARRTARGGARGEGGGRPAADADVVLFTRRRSR